MTTSDISLNTLTIERNGKRLTATVEELHNGDVIVGGVLGGPEPTMVRPDLTNLTLRDGNFDNVLFNEPVELTDAFGVVHNYPAAEHTAHWHIEGGAHHRYYLSTPVDREKERKDLEYSAVASQIVPSFIKLNPIVEEDQSKLHQMQNIFAGLRMADPEGFDRLMEKANQMKLQQENQNG
jgi:hypothetical protein